MKELTALYYPYSRCLNEETLKRSILIYDKLIFIDPISKKVKQNRYSVENHNQYLPNDAAKKLAAEWEYIKNHYDTLTKENIISFYDPTTLLNNAIVDATITGHLQEDMGDQNVFKIFEGSTIKTWSILRSRIPKSAFQYLHHQYTQRVLYDQNIKQPFMSEGNRHHALFSDGKPEQELSVPGYRGKITTDTEAEYAAVIPFYLGSSLSVSSALAIVSATGAIPLTDSSAHHRLLALRFQKAQEKLIKNPYLNIPGLETPSENSIGQLKSLIEYRLVDSILTEEDFKLLSLEDCLNFREKTKNSRKEFQDEISNIAEQIQSDIWSPALNKEIKLKISSLQKTYDTQKKESRKVFRDIVGKSAAGVVISAIPWLISSIVPGVSAAITFILGSTAISGLLADPAKDLLKEWIKDKPKNSLSYLYDLKHRADEKK